jgi:hypothetical protein
VLQALLRPFQTPDIGVCVFLCGMIVAVAGHTVTDGFSFSLYTK